MVGTILLAASRRAKDSLLILSNASKMLLEGASLTRWTGSKVTLSRASMTSRSIFDALDRIKSESFARLDDEHVAMVRCSLRERRSKSDSNTLV
jgi:hypothetical protein